MDINLYSELSKLNNSNKLDITKIRCKLCSKSNTEELEIPPSPIKYVKSRSKETIYILSNFNLLVSPDNIKSIRRTDNNLYIDAGLPNMLLKLYYTEDK